MNRVDVMARCSLCSIDKEIVLWRNTRCRVVLVEDSDYTGYCRIVWQAHVKEMTDLAETDRAHLMLVVFAVEQVLRELMNPEKINLASLGNQAPHLHWHVIPRFVDDPHFPDPIWTTRKRDKRPTRLGRTVLAERLFQHLRAALR